MLEELKRDPDPTAVLVEASPPRVLVDLVDAAELAVRTLEEAPLTGEKRLSAAHRILGVLRGWAGLIAPQAPSQRLSGVAAPLSARRRLDGDGLSELEKLVSTTPLRVKNAVG